MLNQFYRDDLDPTRLLFPIGNSKTSKTSFTCKIYFEGKDGRKDFVGMADAPKALFSMGNADESRDRRPKWQEPKRIYYSLVGAEEETDTR
jgi:hypothetical protein